MQQIPEEVWRIQGSKCYGKIINVNDLNESLYNNVNCKGLVIYSFHFFIEIINIYIQVIGIYILISFFYFFSKIINIVLFYSNIES